MSKISNLNDALKLFEEATTQHAQAIGEGQYKITNKAYDRACKAIAYLKQHNNLLTLKKFLHHVSIGPRYWSALYLLPVMENKSIDILNEIVTKHKSSGVLAEEALEEWRKGGLLHIRALYSNAQ